MDNPVVSYIIVAIIASIGPIISAVLIFRGRRDTSGDAELLDKQAYYTALREENKQLRVQTDLLEDHKRQLRLQIDKLDEEIVELRRQNDKLTEHQAELENELKSLHAEVGLRTMEAKNLNADIVRMNRRIAELEGRNN